MCLFSFLFFFLPLGWHQSYFPRAPWKTNGLALESIWQRCTRGGNKEMSTWFMCRMIFSTIAGRTKEGKKWLMLERCIVRCFDKQSFSANDRNVSSFWKFLERSLPCPSEPVFVSTAASKVVFEGQRASLYLSVSAFLCLFLPLSLSSFKIWSPTFVSALAQKSLNN